MKLEPERKTSLYATVYLKLSSALEGHHWSGRGAQGGSRLHLKTPQSENCVCVCVCLAGILFVTPTKQYCSKAVKQEVK